MDIDHHKTDVASLFPAKTASAIMVPDNLGRWMFTCQVADHLSGGMFAFYEVNKCMFSGTPRKPKLSGRIREYFIAVEEKPWSYASSSENKFDGGRLTRGRQGVKKLFLVSYVEERPWWPIQILKKEGRKKRVKG